MQTYIDKVAKGDSFTVYRKSKPVFTISPAEESEWETVVDFTKIQKGGVEIHDLLSRL
jgi:antitoxin (DNA-binding transcriptional repressor) of toxin-antitoxin stability system